MSLLMQALKKAERAKQNSVHEIELDKPSEAYDEVLSLAPVDAAPVAPNAELSLSPLTEAGPNTGEAPRTASAEAPAQDFTARPARPAESAREAPRPDYSRAKAEAKPRPRPRPATKPGAKSAPRKPLMVEPGTIRLAGLCAILLLTLGGGGFWFWKATTAPGAGADLPMVPMPPPLAAGSIATPPASASAPLEEKADGTVLWRDPSGEAAAPQLAQQQQAPPQLAMQQQQQA
ncbi:MAG TPA: hypothetical protein DCW29_11400, partial [Janthinobacterium sp.]|nr:hypothetical protein [Janthinobacterium sp.]